MWNNLEVPLTKSLPLNSLKVYLLLVLDFTVLVNDNWICLKWSLSLVFADQQRRERERARQQDEARRRREREQEENARKAEEDELRRRRETERKLREDQVLVTSCRNTIQWRM